MEIQITTDAKEDARRYSDTVHKTSTLQNPNYTSLNAEDRYYYGYLGEWAFNQYLKNVGIDSTWNPSPDGKPNTGNFKIGGMVGDVKTATSVYFKMLMIPEAQLKHKRDFYIGVKLDRENNKAIICGWIEKVKLENEPTKDFGHGVPTKSYPLNRLNPIESLTKSIQQTL